MWCSRGSKSRSQFTQGCQILLQMDTVFRDTLITYPILFYPLSVRICTSWIKYHTRQPCESCFWHGLTRATHHLQHHRIRSKWAVPRSVCMYSPVLLAASHGLNMGTGACRWCEWGRRETAMSNSARWNMYVCCACRRAGVQKRLGLGCRCKWDPFPTPRRAHVSRHSCMRSCAGNVPKSQAQRPTPEKGLGVPP